MPESVFEASFCSSFGFPTDASADFPSLELFADTFSTLAELSAVALVSKLLSVSELVTVSAFFSSFDGPTLLSVIPIPSFNMYFYPLYTIYYHIWVKFQYFFCIIPLNRPFDMLKRTKKIIAVSF